MKIAFCLSGGPRFEYRGLFKLVEALKGFDEADFFIRTWKSDQYGITPQQFEYYLRSNGIPDNCNFRVTQVLDDIPAYGPPLRRPLNIANWAPNFLVMWWGVVQAYLLCKNYMAQTGTEYDLIFRMRTDMVPHGDVDLLEWVDLAKTHVINADNFGDNFFFGSPEMFERIVNYWNYMDHLADTFEFIHPEESLEKYLVDNNIPYAQLPVEITPNWNKGEYKGRWRMDHQ